MKKQPLNISEVLNKFVGRLLKKIVVLKAAFYSNPISYFKRFQRRSLWGNLSVIDESLLLKLVVTFPGNFLLKCVIYILNVLFINFLTDSFFIYKHFFISNSKCLNLTPCVTKRNTICENLT